MTYPGDNATAHGAVDAFPSVGHTLRELRMQRGWSIADVSARLKFAPRQIEALENEDWSKLPRGSSLRGLVRNYARLLEIDPDPLLVAVEGPAQAAMPRVTDASVATTIPPVSSKLPPSATRKWSSGGERRRGVGVFTVVLVLIAVGAGYAVFQERLPEQYRIARMLRNDAAVTPPATISGAPGTLSSNPTAAASGPPEVRVPHPLEPAPVTPGAGGAPAFTPGSGTTTTTVLPPVASGVTPPASTPAAPAPTQVPPATVPAPTASATPAAPGSASTPATSPAAPTASATTATAARAAAPAGSSPLVLRVVNDSWVELKATNGTLVSQVLPAGTERSFDVVPPARLVVGNAGGATVSWQGKPMDVRGAQRDNVARLTLQ
jgi:cytoskeleton protein RodZ